MSPLTTAIRRRRAGSRICARFRHAGPTKAPRQNQSASATPATSAMTVAQATPATPKPRPSTNHRLMAMFAPFIASCSTSTAAVRSCAMSQPVSP